MCNGIRLFIWEEHLVNPTQVVYQHISGCSHILVTCSSCLIRRVPCYIFFSSLVAVFLLRFFPVRTYGQTPSLGETRISINLYIQIITRKIYIEGLVLIRSKHYYTVEICIIEIVNWNSWVRTNLLCIICTSLEELYCQYNSSNVQGTRLQLHTYTLASAFGRSLSHQNR